MSRLSLLCAAQTDLHYPGHPVVLLVHVHQVLLVLPSGQLVQLVRLVHWVLVNRSPQLHLGHQVLLLDPVVQLVPAHHLHHLPQDLLLYQLDLKVLGYRFLLWDLWDLVLLVRHHLQFLHFGPQGQLDQVDPSDLFGLLGQLGQQCLGFLDPHPGHLGQQVLYRRADIQYGLISNYAVIGNISNGHHIACVSDIVFFPHPKLTTNKTIGS